MENGFKLETSTVWSFPDRGNWSTHKGDYPGNWSPYVPRNIILRYSKENDLILDQFIGSGTTIVEAKLLNRNIIGYDVNEKALEISKNRIKNIMGNNSVELLKRDARCLYDIKDNFIDLICTHPPYSNIIKYSKDIKEDLSLLSRKDFYIAMNQVAKECYRVLKKDKYCAILMGDTRENGFIIPLGFDVMNIFINSGFKLKEIIIKEQHNCSSTNYWKEISVKRNFYLIAHEYLFIFKK
ncbi:MAG TPA: site-specific DNA-methyltransferase [Clostridiaceae bacterium]|jgi:DNA modification methylase|nr:site-specific DNA-methyltransferase [Clostridiaceae bacterium]HBX48295.1 site-specific DNA-methyltransferase [Clostridiaceae bacterium]HCL50027.1 site-specific DNA-methyltransferase [Clostridiaceae bacterium]